MQKPSELLYYRHIPTTRYFAPIFKFSVFFFTKILHLTYTTYMKINIFALCLCFGLTFIIIPLLLSFILKRNKSVLKFCMFVLLLDYLAVLAIFTLVDARLSYPNLILSSCRSHTMMQMNFVFWGNGLFNYLSNLSMFLPLGIFIFNLKRENKFSCTILSAFLISTIIEILQFVLPICRTTEFADIVLGTVSGLASAMFCELIYGTKK